VTSSGHESLSAEIALELGALNWVSKIAAGRLYPE
jgi:hypothetical protein